jgi:hypothetical protein
MAEVRAPQDPYLTVAGNSEEDEYIGTGDKEPVDDVQLPSTFIHSPVWSAAKISDCLALCKSLGLV